MSNRHIPSNGTTSLGQSVVQSSQYKAKCTYRRNKNIIEWFNGESWQQEASYSSIAGAKHTCRGGKYDNAPVYVVR